MKAKYKTPKGFTLVELLVVIAIIALLAGLAVPAIIGARVRGDQIQAVNNARQIMTAMISFESDYGSYPDVSTATTVTERTASPIIVAAPTSSNDFLRQLIASGVLDSETNFYAKASYTKKPDGVCNTTGTALAAGEVGFSYITNTAAGNAISSGNSGRVLLAAPMLGATQNFDAGVLGGKAIIAKLDSSATMVDIAKSGPAKDSFFLAPGKKVTDNGDDTVWGTAITPVLQLPTPKS